MAPGMSIHCSPAIQRTASTLEWCSMVDLHHDVLIGIDNLTVHNPDHDEMVVAEAVEHGLSKADCLEDVPSHTRQFLGLL
eukprot:12881356-Prorocentrum_lima.AAC.1